MKYIDHPTTIDRALRWVPRIVSLLFVVFISIFAFDVFDEYQGWNLVLALFMHLLPSFVLLAVIVVAWEHDILGVIAFFGFAVLYIVWAGLERPWTWYALISGPAILISVLYFVNWIHIKREKNNE